MRHLLLWMARNRLLKRWLPRIWFVRRATRRFMPGETVEEALDAAEFFRPHGIGILFTHLGENLTDLLEAQAVADHYHGLLDKIAARGLDGEISVKPTQLGLDLDRDAALGHLWSLAEHAAQRGGLLWLDMEGSAYTDATLGLYRSLKERHANVGICLQAYLRRTTADVHALIPLEPAIRLVKGAYDEPASIAFRRKDEVNAAYQSLCVLMLPFAARGELRLGMGTHDTALIERVAGQAAGLGLGKDAFEVEMLYGIRQREQLRLAKEGYRVLALIAYGEAWYAWYMRRLAERPANVLFALRQVFG
ncbi:MAG: proline dehydrogenase family protein [Chloroflexota bacterium]|nr:proline dehydrogenase family protein [Chloroflexota bacterium]